MDKILKELLEVEEKSTQERFLVLHNDDVNTVDHVIESLIKICKHHPTQAEQCTIIAHYQGKCEVKKGNFSDLKRMKDLMIQNKLSATID
ncbi:ATP-dependent Clp protease adaptor ClpS [Puteibacter caeruleilacunae]|nr:ATP-dependent Clp protease adaptor ClpS [Puteibacter caeruleilacunae]